MLTGLTLATVIAASAADSTPTALTLAQAVALAQQHAPAMIAARGQLSADAAGLRAAYAAFLPSLSLSASASRRVPSTGSQTRLQNGQLVTLPADPWSYTAGLGTSVDLFVGGSRIFDLQQAKARQRGDVADEVAQRFAIAMSVAQSFFNALAARESRSAAETQLEQAEQQLQTSIIRLRAHAVTRSDSLRAEIQVRSARLAVLQARTDLVVAEAALMRAVGSNQSVTAAEDSSVDAALSVDDAELRRLAENGPAVTAARAALDAARSARRASWSNYLPSLSASYSRSGNGTGQSLIPSNDGFDYSGSLRFSMSLPVFNQLQREAQVAQTRVSEANAEASLRDAILGTRAGLAQALGTYRTARQRIDSQAATVAAAEEDLRVQTQRYAIGGSTHLDVLTSETQLQQAHSDLIRARFDLRVARAQIEAIVGRAL
jgi:outer membrane protein